MKSNYNSINPHKLYKNPSNGILAGICAGSADYFNISLGLVRFIVVITFMINSPLVIIGYIIMCFILDKKPSHLYKTEDEEQFWRNVSSSPKNTFSDVKYKFATLNERLKKMEDYVTSREFELNSKYKDL